MFMELNITIYQDVLHVVHGLIIELTEPDTMASKSCKIYGCGKAAEVGTHRKTP